MRQPHKAVRSRFAAVIGMACAVSAAVAIMIPGVANADLSKDQKTVVNLLAYGYNQIVAKGQRTLDTDKKFDTEIRKAAKDWKQSYVTIREEFDAQTGGLGEFRGNFERANITNGSATRVVGWTCLPKHPFAHLNVDVYEDGTAPRKLGTVVADQNREAAVGGQCGNTTDHGFDGTVAGVCTTPGAVIPLRIDAFAVDPDFPNVRQPFPSKTGTVRCP